MFTREEVWVLFVEAATQVLGVSKDKVTPEASLSDLDADSLDLVELVMVLEEKLEISIGEDEIEGIKLVGQALDVVLQKLMAAGKLKED